MNHYAEQNAKQVYQGLQTSLNRPGDVAPREPTHLERLMHDIDNVCSRAAELCGGVSTLAERLCGPIPQSGENAGMKMVGPGGVLGELFAKIESVGAYVEAAHSELNRIRRAV